MSSWHCQRIWMANLRFVCESKKSKHWNDVTRAELMYCIKKKCTKIHTYSPFHTNPSDTYTYRHENNGMIWETKIKIPQWICQFTKCCTIIRIFFSFIKLHLAHNAKLRLYASLFRFILNPLLFVGTIFRLLSRVHFSLVYDGQPVLVAREQQ